jgi:hypothetical protein
MTRKYKILIAVFSLCLFFNGVVKLSVINDQAQRLSILEKRTATSRRVGLSSPGPDMGTEKAEVTRILQAVPDIFSFTEQAVKIRELMDKNQFMVRDSLVFSPEKTGAKDLLQYNTRITMAGDYVKIKQFIADIQNLPGLHYIKGLAVTREKENPDRIALSLELALFFKRGPI